MLRFNFRGVGRSAGAWDEGRGEQDDYRAAVDFAARPYPGLDLWAAGFSFGSYIAMTVGAEDDRICTLDRHRAAGEQVRLRRGQAAPRSRSSSSTACDDELIPLKAVREFYARLQDPKELVEIDRANHLFDGQAGEVGDALEDLLQDFTCTTQ